MDRYILWLFFSRTSFRAFGGGIDSEFPGMDFWNIYMFLPFVDVTSEDMPKICVDRTC